MAATPEQVEKAQAAMRYGEETLRSLFAKCDRDPVMACQALMNALGKLAIDTNMPIAHVVEGTRAVYEAHKQRRTDAAMGYLLSL